MGCNLHPKMSIVYIVSLWNATHLTLESVNLFNSRMTYMPLIKMYNKKRYGVPLRHACFLKRDCGQTSECGTPHNQFRLGYLDTVHLLTYPGCIPLFMKYVHIANFHSFEQGSS